MNYSTKVANLNRQGREMLLSLLADNQVVVLFDMDDEEFSEKDEFHDLPQQFVYGKYNSADLYSLHKVYREGDNIFASGYDSENGGDYELGHTDISSDNFLYLVDCVREKLGVEEIKDNVHLAIVSHRFGTNQYASITRAGLVKQIAEYCTDWWAEFSSDECPKNDEDIVQEYFNNAEDVEWCSMSETELI